MLLQLWKFGFERNCRTCCLWFAHTRDKVYRQSYQLQYFYVSGADQSIRSERLLFWPVHCAISVKDMYRYFVVLQYHAPFMYSVSLSVDIPSNIKGSGARSHKLKLCVTTFKQHHLLSFGREVRKEKVFLKWNHQRCKNMPSFFKKLTISLKLSWNYLFKLKSVGQNYWPQSKVCSKLLK